MKVRANTSGIIIFEYSKKKYELDLIIKSLNWTLI